MSKPTPEKRVMFGVSMPPSIYNELDRKAREMCLSRSQIISLIVKAWLIEERKTGEDSGLAATGRLLLKANKEE